MTNNISICCPTFRRYDLFLQLVQSAEHGTVVPTEYVIFDNGGKIDSIDLGFISHKMRVIHKSGNLGCTYGWNRLIEATSDIRVIVNDDIQFLPNTIEELVKAFDPTKLIFPQNDTANGFSCFMLPDYVIEQVGLFDENFFNYFSDNDFVRRINLNTNVTYTSITSTTFGHFGSASLKSYTPAELDQHHKVFRKNQALYSQKWGALPGGESYTSAYNGRDEKSILFDINSRRY